MVQEKELMCRINCKEQKKQLPGLEKSQYIRTSLCVINAILTNVTFEFYLSQGLFGGFCRWPASAHTLLGHQSERRHRSNAASVSAVTESGCQEAIKGWVVLSDASCLLLKHQPTLKRCSHDYA